MLEKLNRLLAMTCQEIEGVEAALRADHRVERIRRELEEWQRGERECLPTGTIHDLLKQLWSGDRISEFDKKHSEALLEAGSLSGGAVLVSKVEELKQKREIFLRCALACFETGRPIMNEEACQELHRSICGLQPFLEAELPVSASPSVRITNPPDAMSEQLRQMRNWLQALWYQNRTELNISAVYTREGKQDPAEMGIDPVVRTVSVAAVNQFLLAIGAEVHAVIQHATRNDWLTYAESVAPGNRRTPFYQINQAVLTAEIPAPPPPAPAVHRRHSPWTVEEYVQQRKFHQEHGADYAPVLVKGAPATHFVLAQHAKEAQKANAKTFSDVLGGWHVPKDGEPDLRKAYNELVLICDESGEERAKILPKLRAEVCRKHGLDFADVNQMALIEFVRLLRAAPSALSESQATEPAAPAEAEPEIIPFLTRNIEDEVTAKMKPQQAKIFRFLNKQGGTASWGDIPRDCFWGNPNNPETMLSALKKVRTAVGDCYSDSFRLKVIVSESDRTVSLKFEDQSGG